MAGLDGAKEGEAAARELPEVEKRIASLEAQLANKSFAERARPEVVAERRQSLADATARRGTLLAMLESD
jgi:valyl-tRNA synthetase